MRLTSNSLARNWFELPADDGSDIISERHTKQNFLDDRDMEKRTHKARKAQITGFMAPPVTRPGNISATKIPINGLKAIVPNPIAPQA